MVVIAILGVLITVLGGQYFGVLKTANEDATRITIGKLEGALAMYAARHRGSFPSSSEGLEAVADFTPTGNVPVDAWGNDFQYNSPAGDKPYEIVSSGQDGQQGTEDDIQSGEADSR